MIKFFFALILFPTAAAAAISSLGIFYSVFLNFKFTLPFSAGIAAYLAAHYFAGRPVRLYILAHELTHAAAAMVSGVKVHAISVGKSGGHVRLSDNNALISLAPYCMPFYAVSAAVVYWVLCLVWRPEPYRNYFVAAAGFLMAFHAVNTAETLTGCSQSDLVKAGGKFFSWSLIILCNSMVLLLALKLMYPEIAGVRIFGAEVGNWTVVFWVKIWTLAKTVSVYLWSKR